MGVARSWTIRCEPKRDGHAAACAATRLSAARAARRGRDQAAFVVGGVSKRAH